jgi:peroxisomal 3,2-trans-enoyl-CoA isomerase
MYIYLDYDAFVNALRNIDKNPAVAVTIWQGAPIPFSPLSILILHLTATGKWFCAGTDVKARMSDGSKVPTETTVRSAFVSGVASTHLDTSKAVGRFILLENAGSPPFRSVTTPRSLLLR